MTRKTMKDFTFSDGMTIPAGNLLSVAIPCIHTDPVRYSFIIQTLAHVYARTGELRRPRNL